MSDPNQLELSEKSDSSALGFPKPLPTPALALGLALAFGLPRFWFFLGPFFGFLGTLGSLSLLSSRFLVFFFFFSLSFLSLAFLSDLLFSRLECLSRFFLRFPGSLLRDELRPLFFCFFLDFFFFVFRLPSLESEVLSASRSLPATSLPCVSAPSSSSHTWPSVSVMPSFLTQGIDQHANSPPPHPPLSPSLPLPVDGRERKKSSRGDPGAYPPSSCQD